MITQEQKTVIVSLLIASLLLFIVPILILFLKSTVLNKKIKKSAVGTMVILSAFLIFSIWSLRFAISLFLIFSSEVAIPNVTKTGEFIDSLFRALRTFGVQDDYSDYIFKLSTLFNTLFSKESIWFLPGKYILLAHASIISLTAPIAGGAILFEILASIFPKIKMGFSYLTAWRKKYFFNELNQASLALASGIYNSNKSFFKKPVIIFTDAYVDDKDEKKVELLLEAKAIGAICVKDDISHITKNRLGSRVFLFMDENESSNLQALADLSDKRNSCFLKNSEIFFVTNGDAYIEIEKRVHSKLVDDYGFSEKEVPTFIPVQSYRNLISDMLVKIPLFEPLIDRKKAENKTDNLTVTILGTGHIGTEMFLSTYWIGQILNCTLNINIVSCETEDSFWNKIDYINPEIRHTTIENDPILRINKKGDMASPYCKVNYIHCDAKSSCFMEHLEESSKLNILNTDYFLVSLGTDELNISVSNTIKNAVGKYHISKRDGSKTVISYVVYDSTLSEMLNSKNLFSYTGETADILMYAVGNINDVYSVKNVFLSEYESSALQTHEAYLFIKGQKDPIEMHKKRITDDYTHWANLARSMHIKYKMFSMGVLYDSVFNFKNMNDEIYIKSIEVSLDRYKRIAIGETDIEDPVKKKEHIELLHKMAWLEHRRWNAFTRVKGFRHTDDYDYYAIPGKSGSYKQMELKLHPCLVECDDKGIRAGINEKCVINEEEIFKSEDYLNFDLLDDLSYDLYEKGFNSYDFKQYDYPISDFK